MDVFIEYMVKKQGTLGELLLKILYAVLAIAILAAAILFGGLLGPFSMIATLLGLGAVYGAYYLITSMNVEYEYILTNGEMDVDKIIAKRRRKRITTVNARKFEEFGAYRAEAHAGRDYVSRIYACESPDAPNNYYAVFTHATMGKTLLVFTPNDRVLDGLRTYIPRQVLR